MSKKTLVIGASDNAARYSNLVIRKLLSSGHEVVAIGKREAMVDDVKIEIKPLSFSDIDTVTLYLNAENQKEYYKYIVSLKPRRVIFNPGTENPEFYKILDENNIPYEIACSLVLLSTNQY